MYQFYTKRVPVYFVQGGFLGSQGWYQRRSPVYSFGIGFVDFVVPSLSADWMDPIPILYQSALLKLVLLVQILKIALPRGAS